MMQTEDRKRLGDCVAFVSFEKQYFLSLLGRTNIKLKIGERYAMNAHICIPLDSKKRHTFYIGRTGRARKV